MRIKKDLFANSTWSEGEDENIIYGTSVDSRFDVVEMYSGRILVVQNWEKNHYIYEKAPYKVLFHEERIDYAVVQYVGWPDSDI